MTSYTAWFRGNRERTEMRIDAYSTKQAREIFAAYHNCAPSNYIAIRKTHKGAA